jgi:hypothetical protein
LNYFNVTESTSTGCLKLKFDAFGADLLGKESPVEAENLDPDGTPLVPDVDGVLEVAGYFPLAMEQADAGVVPILLNLLGSCKAMTGEAPLLEEFRLLLKLNDTDGVSFNLGKVNSEVLVLAAGVSGFPPKK